MSDKLRWKSDGYNISWYVDLEESDIEIIKRLQRLGDGEYSGLGSTILLYDMILHDIPKEYQSGFSEIIMYSHIIAYEEMRHGIAVSNLYEAVSNNNPNYLDTVSVQEISDKFIFGFEDNVYWDAYGLLISHCLSEVPNCVLYKDVLSQAKHPKLKSLIKNILRDEIRHKLALTEIVLNLVNLSEYHKQRCLDSLESGLNHHNALQHGRYFEGINDMAYLFNKGASEVIVKDKFNIIQKWFGEDNPYTYRDLIIKHLKFTQLSKGKVKSKACPEEQLGFCFE